MRTVVLRTGLSRHEVLRCIGRGLVRQPLTESGLAERRRIRRLQDMGVNLAGVEIILSLRRHIIALESELERRNLDWYPPEPSRGDDRWRRLLGWEPGTGGC